MFEVLLFDFDGTLVDFVEADIESLKWLHFCVGSPVCFDDFLETSVDEIMRFHRLVDEGKIDPLLMHEFRLRNTFTKHEMVWDDDYVDVYRKKLLTTCIPFDGVEGLLAGVKQKVKIGLITNAYDGQEQRERIRNSGLEAYFDLIVIAGEIGLFKPEPSIFLYALNHFGVATDKVLYIGDSVTYDILGAKSVGMKTVLLRKDVDRGSDVADYIIAGIDDLQGLLEQVI